MKNIEKEKEKQSNRKEISICVCEFKRTKDSKVELGIMLGNNKLIVDSNFKPIKTIWNYKPATYKGCILLNLQ